MTFSVHTSSLHTIYKMVANEPGNCMCGMKTAAPKCPGSRCLTELILGAKNRTRAGTSYRPADFKSRVSRFGLCCHVSNVFFFLLIKDVSRHPYGVSRGQYATTIEVIQRSQYRLLSSGCYLIRFTTDLFDCRSAVVCIRR